MPTSKTAIPAYLLNEHYNDRFFDVISAVESDPQALHPAGGKIERKQNAKCQDVTAGDHPQERVGSAIHAGTMGWQGADQRR